jgi:hypothetical protein
MASSQWAAVTCKTGDGWEVPAGKLVRLVRGAVARGHFGIARRYLERAHAATTGTPSGGCLLAMEMAARTSHPARRSATIGRARRR